MGLVQIPPIPTASHGDMGNVTIFSKYGMHVQSIVVDNPQQPIIVHFEPQHLESIAGTGYAQYIMRTGTPGTSDIRAAYFQETVPTPRLKGYEDDFRDSYTVPSDAAESGLSISIPPYENMEQGDNVTLFASASVEGAGKWVEHPVRQGDLLKPLEFFYEAENLKALRPGAVNVSYVVSKAGVRHHSRPMSVEILPLLPDPEAKYQTADTWGTKIFLLTVERENDQFYAPVLQLFPSQQLEPGDELTLLVTSRYPHSYAYPFKAESPTSTVEFKIPEAHLLSLKGQTIKMATLWRRNDGKLITSQGGPWLVGGQEINRGKQPSKKA